MTAPERRYLHYGLVFMILFQDRVVAIFLGSCLVRNCTLSPVIVAIDGPAGSGKSTTARLLAERLGYHYLDTGAMYRAVAYALADSPIEDESVVRERLEGLQLAFRHEPDGIRVLVNGEDVTDSIRTPEVGALSSRISAYKAVREKLVAEQRRFAREYLRQGGGVVVEGRDIGTVVFPDADVKIFMVADPAIRARRRQEQLEAAGKVLPYETILQEIVERDRQDSERELSPLRRAEDAIDLDTTKRSIGEQVDFVIEKVKERKGRFSV